MKTPSRWGRRILIAVLFALLVLVLLWFQGILLRREHPPAEIAAAAAVEPTAAIARVERRVLPEVRVYPGFVEAVDPAAIAPRVMATVLAVAAREGDPVAEGEIVVRLDDRDARARLSQAESALEAAGARALETELAYQRATRLHDADALTTQEWESARAARDGAHAQEERSRQAVEEAEATLTWFELAAPFAGRILERDADPGDLATPGRPLLRVYREDRLRFRVAIPEERAPDVSVGAELELAFDGLPPRGAELTRILPPADTRSGTVVLHLAPSTHDDLRPGLLGRLRLAVGEREALVVPRAAVERIGQVERVRLVRDGRVGPVTVRTGKEHEDVVEILSGLEEGEELVVP